MRIMGIMIIDHNENHEDDHEEAQSCEKASSQMPFGIDICTYAECD